MIILLIQFVNFAIIHARHVLEAQIRIVSLAKSTDHSNQDLLVVLAKTDFIKQLKSAMHAIQVAKLVLELLQIARVVI